MKEIFKSIPDYPKYLVSNLGRVKSLYFNKEKIVKSQKSSNRYLNVGLVKDGNKKNFMIHQLVAMAFLNHKVNGHKFVVDHIDENKHNNKLSNLRIVTHRFNSSRRKGSSKYTGVSWYKPAKKWRSYIKINGKSKHLGYFKFEYDAHLRYQKELKLIIKN
mgnify:CR=1 FL=1